MFPDCEGRGKHLVIQREREREREREKFIPMFHEKPITFIDVVPYDRHLYLRFFKNNVCPRTRVTLQMIRATVKANFTRPCFETHINFYVGIH